MGHHLFLYKFKCEKCFIRERGVWGGERTANAQACWSGYRRQMVRSYRVSGSLLAHAFTALGRKCLRRYPLCLADGRPA